MEDIGVKLSILSRVATIGTTGGVCLDRVDQDGEKWSRHLVL